MKENTTQNNNIEKTRKRSVRHLAILSVCAAVCMLLSCSVSYKFNGASIDYSKTKTIQIADFPIRASYVWGPMASIFNNQLKDLFANHTKLIQVRRNGDLKIEGEITRYEQRNKSVSSEGYSSQTELSMTVPTTPIIPKTLNASPLPQPHTRTPKR